MKNENIEGLEKRIKLAEERKGVFKRKSDDYINFCIEEYKNVIISGIEFDWFDEVDRVETEAKKKYIYN